MSTFKDFNKIYKTFKDKIYNYFLFKTNFDKELSEDLTEEVFEKVIENINSLKDENNLKVWIYRIAHNKLVDYFRKKKDLLIFDDEDENIDSKITNELEYLSNNNFLENNKLNIVLVKVAYADSVNTDKSAVSNILLEIIKLNEKIELEFEQIKDIEEKENIKLEKINNKKEERNKNIKEKSKNKSFGNK